MKKSLQRKILSALVVGVGFVPIGVADSDTSSALLEIRRRIDEARFDEAELEARRLLSRVEADHGADSPRVAEVLDLLVETLWRARKTTADETRELAERAVRIKEDRLGREHMETAESLRNLAVVLEFRGRPGEAEPLYRRAVDITERARGPTSPELADALTYLGNMYLNTTRFDEALPLYERVLRIRTERFGPHHPKVARALSNLANLLRQTGEYATAESMYRRTLAIEESAFGVDHIDVAWTLNALAGLLWETGQFSEARALYTRALAIREESLGPEHLHVLMTLNNIGLLSRDLGEYTVARSAFARALAIAEKLGPDNTYTATINNNLVELYRRMGDYEQALQLQNEALAIRVRTHGPDHVSVAGALEKIAAIQLALGRHDAAAGNYRRMFDIYRAALGERHVEYGRALAGLAEVHLATGRSDEARDMLARSVTIQEEALGSDHPSIAQTLEQLARLELDAGNLASARMMLERTLEIRESALGPRHPQVGGTLVLLGELLNREGRDAESLATAVRAEALGREHLRLSIRSLAERQALRYAGVRTSGLNLILSLAADGLDSASTRTAWDALCRSRALVLDEMALRRGVFSRDGDPAVAALKESLAGASRRLANLTLSGPGDLSGQRYRDLLADARDRRDRAEIALAEASAAFRREREQEQVGLKEVRAVLPADTAVVAFAAAADVYLAFVLPGADSSPVAVPLGTTGEIESLVSRWRAEAGSPPGVDGRTDEEAEAAYRAAGTALRKRIWDPLAPRVRSAKRVLIVPDGALHLVSFAALPVEDDRYLIESGPVLTLLSAERDVVSHARPRASGEGLLALGGPEFDNDATETHRAAAAAFRGERGACGDLRAIRFAALPASAREADAVVALWREAGGGTVEPTRLTGAQATEAAFKELAAGKRVLHLATHGFFLGSDCFSSARGGRGIGGLTSPKEPRAGDASPAADVLPENPLLLSGLAMAGANRRDRATLDREDGILTAEEIAAMDLSGVQWAVLSACDTGIGRVQAGEGVLGLRRAFQIAGAGSVIMSLWAVGDDATAEWMRILYESRLEGGLATADAVRAAGLSLLERRRGDEETTHPFFWGAFVAAGDWK